MLETRNLKKVYKTKKGVSVTALNDVSIKFPEKGLVFLLGKSGSGKSTLLNLLGGLDKYDEGEIIIKGVSSKDFKQSHFDSYRNTYVGFIFQEYNVLEEFSVGANIALAIELQGKKATDEEINSILKQVDLEGFGDRKPNELSGGQKQRVAIARALVKQPEIIMADEPTGALDSNTGRQVFETLKNLSKDKLVIVVSHDREFAEQFGDRIIELADGNVIDDVTRKVGYEKQGEEINNGISFENDTMTIKSGYHLTEEDRERINQYIDGIGTDLKAVIKKADRGSFQQTNEEDIVHKKGDFKLIKSKLPLKNAFKIGASGLKHKKIRLVVTILLSFVAFSLFALADTFGNYNHIKTCTNSIKDTNITYASVIKSLKIGSGMNAYWNDYGNSIREDEITKLNKDTGLDFTGLPEENFDDPLGESTGAAVIFGTTGGVMEAALRTAVETLTGEELAKVDFEDVRGTDGIKEATYNVAGMDVKVAVASGLQNAKELLDKVNAGEADYHFIEIMGCPGGCVNGGGQPQVSADVRNFTDVRAARAKVLYDNDAKKAIRKSHENPSIQKLYEEFLGRPGSQKAHEILHTSYIKRTINSI